MSPVTAIAAIQRTYYTLGGQMIGVRVKKIRSNGVTESDDLYYTYTDHLGNVTALSDVNGKYVSNSLALFRPFGSYRLEPATNPGVTDRGFTGHKEHLSLGLTYMNARYYLGENGRFASADTIIPDPTNPQSFNRYSYVFNRPLDLHDPSGHEPMWCSAEYDGGAGCSPLVSFQGGHENWTSDEITAIKMAAWQVAFDLHRHGQANSASEQFLAVYGGTVNFRKTGVLADNLGEAISKNLIIVNKHALVTISSATTGKMWAAHELGHAFNYALHPNTTDDLNYGQGFIDLALKGIVADGERFAGLEPQGSTSYANFDNYNRGLDLGYQGDSGPWVQNKTSSPSEDFADMFSNWAFDSFSPDIYGSARYSFMENHMSVWTALAVSNN